MAAQKNLINRLILSVLTVIALIVAASAIFDIFYTYRKFSLDDSSYGDTAQISLSAEEYEAKIAAKSSFLLFIDQSGCITAADLRAILDEISTEKNLHFYHLYWTDMRSTSLYNSVKFYPSVVIIDHGEVRAYLDANSEQHADLYHDKEKLLNWLNQYIIWR